MLDPSTAIVAVKISSTDQIDAVLICSSCYAKKKKEKEKKNMKNHVTH